MQSSKDEILASLGEENSLVTQKPSLKIDFTTYLDRVDKFTYFTKQAGAEVYQNSKNLNIQNLFKNVKITVDTSLDSRFEFKNIQNVDLTILKAEFGVAENGALWIEWQDEFYPRALLTISKYLAIFLEKDKIVDNLHQAYELIDFSRIGYGVFLSGPSKTADIEQSLVIGAHGALRVAVILV